MNDSTARLPDFDRADAGTILVSEWIVGTADRQAAAIEATYTEWRALTATPGFLSLCMFADTDGERILNYAQWTGDEPHRQFMRRDRPALVRGIDQVVPGIERPGVQRYRRYRGIGPGRPDVTDRIAFVQFDTHDDEHATALVDGMINRLRTTGSFGDRAAAHFHIRKDGRRGLGIVPMEDDMGERLDHLVADLDGPQLRAYRLNRSLSRNPG